MAVLIPLDKGYVVIVDDIDGDLSKFTWKARVVERNVYAGRREGTPLATAKWILIHQVVLSRMLGRPLVKGDYPDHINNDSLNCKRENIRLSTNAQNGANARLSKANTTGYKGVTYSKHAKRFKAQIMFQRKNYALGYYNTAEEAAKIYNYKAVELFGEFARLNIIKE